MKDRDLQTRFPNPKSPTRNIQRAGYVAILFFIFVFGVGLSKRIFESWLRAKAAAGIESVADRFGLDVTFDALRIGAQSIEFQSLRIKKNDVELFADSIRISLDVDLGLPTKIIVKEVKSGDVELKLNALSKSGLNHMIKELYDLSKNLNNESQNSEVAGKSSRSWILPSVAQQITFGLSNLLVTHHSYPEVNVTNSQGSIIRGPTHELSLRSQKILVDSQLIHHEVSFAADFFSDDQENLDFTYHHESRHPLNRAAGKLGCQISNYKEGDLVRAQCRFSDFLFPSEIISRVGPKGSSLSNVKLSGAASIDVSRRLDRWIVDYRGRLSGLKVFHPRLSLEEVGPINAMLATKFVWDQSTQELSVPQLSLSPELGTKDARAFTLSNRTQINVKRPFSTHRVVTGDLQVKWTHQSCQRLLQAIPKGLLGELADMKLTGYSSGELSFHLGQQAWDLNRNHLDIGCKIDAMPPSFDAESLRSEFSLTRSFGSNEQIHLTIGKSQPGYISIDRVPNSLVNAVVLSEDAGFWGHRGVDLSSLEDAFELNSKKGVVTLGGSTITMQTAKNLFFPRNRALSRKLQEMITANYLETQLGKRRILEIYLNLVEFGPGVYGVERASRHFFNVSTSQLTDKQSIYLASLLPAPTTRFASYCTDHIPDNHRAVVDRLLQKFKTYSKISEEAYLKAAKEPILFDDKHRWRCKEYFANRDTKTTRY